MKVFKLVALALVLIVSVSCKKEQNEPEVVEIEYKEEVKKKEIAENATLAKTQFNIEGMTCAVGCAAKIEKSLAKMEGVASAKVDFESKTAVVEYDVDKVNTGLLAERVAKNGDMYKVSNIETVTDKCSKDCKKACCTAKKETKECAKDCKKACCVEKA